MSIGTYLALVVRQRDELAQALAEDLKAPQQVVMTEDEALSARAWEKHVGAWVRNYRPPKSAKEPRRRRFRGALDEAKRAGAEAVVLFPGLQEVNEAHEALLSAYHTAWQDHTGVPPDVGDRLDAAIVRVVNVLPLLDGVAPIKVREHWITATEAANLSSGTLGFPLDARQVSNLARKKPPPFPSRPSQKGDKSKLEVLRATFVEYVIAQKERGGEAGADDEEAARRSAEADGERRARLARAEQEDREKRIRRPLH